MPDHGNRYSTTGTVYGDTVLYECLPGYTLQGSKTRTCLVTGQWSGSLPNCTRKQYVYILHINLQKCHMLLDTEELSHNTIY